ncbi:hypothetical protein PACTADRAFT_77690 [Pachysolen tannophilus NRRL Y-2460]|uniref:Uncharacterized protein n=1 Tax=Pachysolen tannophilus NRRL Y-2460 TaxID=669874 RepID=A0A1E4TNL0_PACTA|nr:hypothetical protein PACTADRAFT_77690 [Pachysolen tannophilus NRRL Y-2460]
MLFDNVEKTDNNNNNDLLKDESNTDDQLKAELFEPDHSPTVMDVPALNIGEHALVKSDIEDDNLSAHPHSKENLSEQISSVTSPKITNANFEDEEEEEEEEEKELETAKTVRTSYSIDGYNDISEFVEKHLLTESDTEDLSQIQKDESLALGNETSFNLNEAETMVDVETETQFHSPVTQDSGAEEKTEAERGGKAVTEIEAEAETANEIENLKGSSSVQKQNRRHFRIFRRRKNNENNYTIEESKDTSVVTMDTKQSIEEEKEEKEEEQEGEVKNEQEKEQDEDEHEKKDEKQKKLKKPKKEKRKKKHKNDKTMDLECENEELQPLPTAKSIKSIKSTTSLKTTKSFKERLSRRRIRAYQKVFHPRHGKIENYDMDPWKKDNHVCDTCEDCSYIIGSGKSPSVKSPVTSDKSPFLNSPVPPKKDSDSDLHNHSNSSVEKEEQKEDESEANATKVIIVDEDIILPVEEKQYE